MDRRKFIATAACALIPAIGVGATTPFFNKEGTVGVRAEEGGSFYFWTSENETVDVVVRRMLKTYPEATELALKTNENKPFVGIVHRWKKDKGVWINEKTGEPTKFL